MSLKDPSSRILIWSLKLAEYDYIIIHRFGKQHQNVDALRRNIQETSNLAIKAKELLPITDLNTVLKA